MTESGGDGRDLDRPLPNRGMAERVRCPFCDGSDTEPFSAFGSSLSVSQYYCRGCRTVFEWVKWRGDSGGEE